MAIVIGTTKKPPKSRLSPEFAGDFKWTKKCNDEAFRVRNEGPISGSETPLLNPEYVLEYDTLCNKHAGRDVLGSSFFMSL